MISIKHVILLILFVTSGQVAAVDDGVYLLKRGGTGSTLRFPGGVPAEIDQKLEGHEYLLKISSVTNWNVSVRGTHLSAGWDGWEYGVHVQDTIDKANRQAPAADI